MSPETQVRTPDNTNVFAEIPHCKFWAAGPPGPNQPFARNPCLGAILGGAGACEPSSAPGLALPQDPQARPSNAWPIRTPPHAGAEALQARPSTARPIRAPPHAGVDTPQEGACFPGQWQPPPWLSKLDERAQTWQNQEGAVHSDGLSGASTSTSEHLGFHHLYQQGCLGVGPDTWGELQQDKGAAAARTRNNFDFDDIGDEPEDEDPNAPSRQKRNRHCKEKRNRYRRLITRLVELAKTDQQGFLEELKNLPPSIAACDKSRAKLLVTVEHIIACEGK